MSHAVRKGGLNNKSILLKWKQPSFVIKKKKRSRRCMIWPPVVESSWVLQLHQHDMEFRRIPTFCLASQTSVDTLCWDLGQSRQHHVVNPLMKPSCQTRLAAWVYMTEPYPEYQTLYGVPSLCQRQ